MQLALVTKVISHLPRAYHGFGTSQQWYEWTAWLSRTGGPELVDGSPLLARHLVGRNWRHPILCACVDDDRCHRTEHDDPERDLVHVPPREWVYRTEDVSGQQSSPPGIGGAAS